MRYFVVDAFADKLFQGEPRRGVRGGRAVVRRADAAHRVGEQSFRDGLFGAPG